MSKDPKPYNAYRTGKQVAFYLDKELVDWLEEQGGIKPTIVKLIQRAKKRKRSAS
jgi:hypothetical protein